MTNAVPWEGGKRSVRAAAAVRYSGDELIEEVGVIGQEGARVDGEAGGWHQARQTLEQPGAVGIVAEEHAPNVPTPTAGLV